MAFRFNQSVYDIIGLRVKLCLALSCTHLDHVRSLRLCLRTDLWASYTHPSPHKQNDTFHRNSVMARLRDIHRGYGPAALRNKLKRHSWGRWSLLHLHHKICALSWRETRVECYYWAHGWSSRSSCVIGLALCYYAMSNSKSGQPDMRFRPFRLNFSDCSADTMCFANWFTCFLWLDDWFVSRFGILEQVCYFLSCNRLDKYVFISHIIVSTGTANWSVC